MTSETERNLRHESACVLNGKPNLPATPWALVLVSTGPEDNVSRGLVRGIATLIYPGWRV